MARSVLVVAPHPDDEVLGCGGVILKHVDNGDDVHWCIATQMSKMIGYSDECIIKRNEEIREVYNAFGFKTLTQFKYAATTLDAVAKSKFVMAFKEVFEKVKPHTVYLPHPADIHSDHAATFEAAIACSKWFRFESVKRILCYEVLSETDFQISPLQSKFQPNVFIDVSNFFEKKMQICSIYESEMGEFPFPRSMVAIEALAKVRGAACGKKYAEAFQVLKEIID